MKPSAPAPADLLMTIHGFGDRLYLETSGEMNRAMTSAPPPAPAGTMNSTGLSGTQAFAVPMEVNTNAKEHATTRPIFSTENLFPMDVPSHSNFLRPASRVTKDRLRLRQHLLPLGVIP